MTTTLTETTRNNGTHTLRLSLDSSIPFQIPLFEDPRTMNKAKLVSLLNTRQLNTTGPKPVLVARLLKDIVKEGLQRNFKPEDMDDRQPEKWLHIGNISFAEACRIEQDPESRVVCFGRCNAWIEATITDQRQLIDVAKGVLFPDNESPLFRALLRFGAALMIQPEVEQEAVRISVV